MTRRSAVVTGGPQRNVARLRRTVVVLGMVALLAGLAACGGDDDAERADGSASETSVSATTTTQPPATGDDQDEAFRAVEAVVVEATALTDELLQDPTAVEDPDNEDVARLRELYTADSPTPDRLVEQLQEMVADGQREQAARSGIFRELGVYELTVIDEDTVRFRVCATEDKETVDRDGNVVTTRAQVTQATGEARRVDGVWRFYGMNIEADRTLPIEPGTATPGFCDTLFPDGGAGGDDETA